ncbi:hypothetical protein FKM82_028975 [Ascaphus truei]
MLQVLNTAAAQEGKSEQGLNPFHIEREGGGGSTHCLLQYPGRPHTHPSCAVSLESNRVLHVTSAGAQGDPLCVDWAELWALF